MMIENIVFQVIQPVANDPVYYMSTLALDNRFTPQERAKIDLASIDNPAGSDEARMGAASIRVFLQRAAKAKYVDPSRTDTREGVLALEAFGLIGEGRALEILDSPIQPHERYTD